ncbi:glycosyltransferase family 9 protein [Fusobacterium russii]|uniref:glycosyltransferase family 9 protein n=1 Tax=Fusobacterium russii TaxID=854 RepID=UPI0003AA1091|nr:glycosyltransferase family 9 protein [Fusobacterium russii]
MKILIIHTAFIGDIVLATTLVAKLKDKYPNSDIYFLTTPVGKSILENNPKIKEIISYDKRGKDKGLKAFFNLAKKLRKMNFDICICPHRYLRSTILAFLSTSKIKIGYDISSLSFLYDEKIKYDKNKHEVEKLLSFVDKIEKRYEIELYSSEENQINIKKLLPQGKKIITIAPGSKWFTKKWPEEYFRILIKNLLKINDIIIVISGGNEEKEIKLDLAPEVLDLRGKISLLDLAELCRLSSIVVSNDSAPIHIASAFPKTRILGIFGPTVKEFGFFPWSKNSRVFEINGLYCRPCGIHGGKVCPEKHFKCMKEILPETIEREIIEYLKKID